MGAFCLWNASVGPPKTMTPTGGVPNPPPGADDSVSTQSEGNVRAALSPSSACPSRAFTEPGAGRVRSPSVHIDGQIPWHGSKELSQVFSRDSL